MEQYSNMAVILVGFAVLALASRQIGVYFKKARLPLISGFLAAGMVVGPYGLGFITVEAVESLRLVDHIALAFIAFAAGSELHLAELKDRFKSIAWVTLGLVFFTFVLGSLAAFLLAEHVPFMRSLSTAGRVSVALLAGAILVARSPSSAIAIVKELRAKGPFTRMVLGVTVIMDVVVITLFGFSASIADALLADYGLDIGFLALLAVQLGLSAVLGWLLGKLLHLLLSLKQGAGLKQALVLLVGYLAFYFSHQCGFVCQEFFGVKVEPEPLLICMIGGFHVVNFSGNRVHFEQVVHDIGPPVFVAFFTLTGASLALDILLETWHIALVLFLVRLGSLFLGALAGGSLAGDPAKHNRIGWLAFVTQAGIGLGLAKGVAVEFPEWGAAFATMMISVIVVNQLVGPPLFKWAIHLVKESHERADFAFDGVRDAVIFGLEGQSVALARQLTAHGWHVKIAKIRDLDPAVLGATDLNLHRIHDFSAETLASLDLRNAEVVVTLLSDEENYEICESVYEHFGTPNLVVRLNDRANRERFAELGAHIVHPDTAMVGLLDHVVRSPMAAELLMGTEENQDVIELEIRDPAMHGKLLRDLHLPLDTLVLSVSRDGHMIVSHGYTKLHLGDHVTVVGSDESLKDVTLLFDSE